MRSKETKSEHLSNGHKKTLKELNLMDRFLCAEAVEDQEFLETVLAIILEKDISLKHPPQAEKEIRGELRKKKVRVDVWATDEENVVYDLEAQDKDTKNLPKRSRYYQGLMDSKLLPVGTIDYNKLNDAVIILIAPFDLFGKGLYKYTFSMICEEKPDIMLGDGAVRIFLNTGGKNRENASEELIAMLRYFETSTEEVANASGSERILALHKKVEAIRNNEEIGVKYMNALEEKLLERQEGFEEGEACGFEKGKFDVAKKMLKKGKEKEEIAEITGLSMERIEALLAAEQ